MRIERSHGLQPYLPLIDVMLRRLAADDVVERLWAGDAGLWHPSPETQARIKQRLGWLLLPAPIEPTIDTWLETMQRSGYQSVLIVATGAAAATVRLWRDSPGSNALNIVLLDTIEPVAADAILASVDTERTAVVLLGIELTLELRALCWLVFARLGCHDWQQHRILLVTTPQSPFEQWLRQQISAQVSPLPPTVSERFGTLSALGWLPARLYGHAVADAVQDAQRMRLACHETTNLTTNPGVWLGVVLGVLAQQGRDILTLIASPALVPLAGWIASFVSGSLSKHRRGFVPIVDEPIAHVEKYRHNRIFVHLSLVNNDDQAVSRQLAALEADGHPVLRLRLESWADLAAEIARWEVAVAVAALIIGLNPFDEPDTDAMQRFMQRRLTGEVSTTAPDVIDVGHDDLGSALRQLLDRNRYADYAALVCYFEPTEEMVAMLEAIRTLLHQRYRLATFLAFPLRDHAASAQLLHAGRDNGVFIAFVPERDMEQPDLGSTFNELGRARFEADMVGWKQLCRAHLAVKLGIAGDKGLRQLRFVLSQI